MSFQDSPVSHSIELISVLYFFRQKVDIPPGNPIFNEWSI